MEDTIAAISTAYGEGGIGIIRISGEDSLYILESLFFSGRNGNDKIDFRKDPRKLCYGIIKDPSTGEMVDEVLAVYMPAPHTYTTEDVVEIDCHGSIVSLRRILSLCLGQGARLAEEGEFTKRAFLGGRLDLSQAEAVIDMIRAKTDSGFDAAARQLEGRLSEEIKKIRVDLLDVLVNITVNIDYPDEDIEEVIYSDMERDLIKARDDVSELIADGEKGRIVREGIEAAIIGKPNVGKSSLMNGLLRESRAIVTEIPGTTRDTIEESISISGIPVRLTDTAGIRETDDMIEQIGIEKSIDTIRSADLVIFIIDVSRELEKEDIEIIEQIKNSRMIVLANKQDLEPKLTTDKIREMIPDGMILETTLGDDDPGRLNEEIKTIENLIYEMVMGGEIKQANSLMVTNVRHLDLLKKCLSSINDAVAITRLSEPLEVIEIDISSAYAYLGEIIGEEVSDDILKEVFSRFCLGK